ncbi:hypothetical protein FQU76_08185 [Streptomyces qinzhouensis]|uniref:Uncharacterized protein n=1 Tax=Streptomyces qinzhouensis TaxID=2599401 RepID=A0A5B8J5J2_9ACTN|nr:hypothetical protein [Streptomyces qinzhouensis]QDY76516.1 hypothetical protein FQU76_08185 [Streptomyces qinzhouensis]
MATVREPGNFASASLPRHLVRGAAGFGSLAGSVLLLPVTGPVSLLLAPVGLLVLRGCPMCWTVGLVQTLSRGRLRRECHDGRCELRPADGAVRPKAEARP